VTEPVALPPVARERGGVPSLVRFGAPTLLLVVAVTSVVAFTSGNTVPVSYAGASNKPVALGQLAPSQCSGIALANQITMTTNSTSGTAAADFILGRNVAATVTINGGSGDDCLVGGGSAGTTNKFDGGAGTNDVCIGAPGATNTFKNCEATY
jgi:hypothetical protein